MLNPTQAAAQRSKTWAIKKSTLKENKLRQTLRRRQMKKIRIFFVRCWGRIHKTTYAKN